MTHQGGTASSRRGQDRRTILKAAKAVFNNGKGVLICRVRDLSPGGARLEFPPRQALPDAFDLHVTGQPVRHCERRWTRNNVVGVRFVDPSQP
ncbi:MAG TPA: PilZ domain-containing protein [Dongiaceae bacterium]